MDEKNDRFRQALEYLTFSRQVRNQLDFCKMVNYDQPTISQCKNGRCIVPNNLLIEMSQVFPCLNIDWLLYGNGEMLTSDASKPLASSSSAHKEVTIPEDVWLVIKQQAASLERRDQQISQLIDIISNNNKIKKEDTLAG